MKKLNIYLQDIEKVWFTSDPHFGHANIMKFCDRPFESVKDMDEALIHNWNECVTDNDIVFMLGDFCWNKTPGNIMKILNQLNGKRIYIIPGNHDNPDIFKNIDADWSELSRYELLSDIVHVYIRCNGGDQKPLELILSHYPLMTWSGRNRRSINLHGHVHSKPGQSDESFDGNLPYWKGYQLDVGVDSHNYKPIDLQQVLVELEKQKEP